MRWNWFVGAAAILLAVAGTSVAAPLVSGSLTVYYDFNSFTDEVADGSGNDYHGTVYNDVTQGGGLLGGGGAVFGTNTPFSNYVDLPVDQLAQADIPTSAFTLATWVNVEQPIGSEKYALFCPLADDPLRDPGTWLLHPEIRNDRYRFTVRDYDMTSIGDLYVGEGDPDLPVFGRWHHIAMVYSKAAAKQYLYVDGKLVANQSVEAALNMADNWDLGARVGLNIDNARQFVGEMDEFYVFNRALSSSEVATLGQHPADLNSDGFIGGDDLDIVRSHWGSHVTVGSLADGDPSGDGFVGGDDLDMIRSWWGWGTPPTEPSAVPEPAALSMLLPLGLALLVLRRRRTQ